MSISMKEIRSTIKASSRRKTGFTSAVVFEKICAKGEINSRDLRNLRNEENITRLQNRIRVEINSQVMSGKLVKKSNTFFKG